MPASFTARPIDVLPELALPVDLVQRMLTSHLAAAEFQAILIVAMISRRPGQAEAAVSEHALRRHELTALAGDLEGTAIRDDDWIWQPIEQALSHGFLLRFTTSGESEDFRWYMLNTIDNARLVFNISSGATPVPDYVWIDDVPPKVTLDRPTVFRLYEQNIGPLTPLIAERLINAVELYPVEWIEKAIAESVAYNRRNWRYIVRILENWAADGLPNATGSR